QERNQPAAQCIDHVANPLQETGWRECKRFHRSTHGTLQHFLAAPSNRSARPSPPAIRSRAPPRPAGLRSEIKEEATAAGGGRRTFAETASRSRRGPSDHAENQSTPITRTDNNTDAPPPGAEPRRGRLAFAAKSRRRPPPQAEAGGHSRRRPAGRGGARQTT